MRHLDVAASQREETWAGDPEVTAQAQNNGFENFRLVFDPRFINTVVGRMDDNEAIFKRISDDEKFQQVLKDWYAARVYQRGRTDPRSGSPRLADGRNQRAVIVGGPARGA
jgi:hypothetical protein